MDLAPKFAAEITVPLSHVVFGLSATYVKKRWRISAWHNCPISVIFSQRFISADFAEQAKWKSVVHRPATGCFLKHGDVRGAIIECANAKSLCSGTQGSNKRTEGMVIGRWRNFARSVNPSVELG
jgi:hypothetical protein